MKNGVPSVFSRMSCLRACRGAPCVRPRPVGRHAGRPLQKHRGARQGIPPLRLCQTALTEAACNTSSAPTRGDTPADSCQEQKLGTGHTLTQGVEKPLGLTVDPVQIFKDEDQGLVETLSQEELLERLKRPSTANLRVHLLQTRGSVLQCPARQTDRATCLPDCGRAQALCRSLVSRRVRSSS